MKNQGVFSLKNKSKKIKCRLLQYLFGVFRIKIIIKLTEYYYTCIVCFTETL